MKTINFGKNLRLSQIQPIKTAEIKSIQFGKKKVKPLHPVDYQYYYRGDNYYQRFDISLNHYHDQSCKKDGFCVGFPFYFE
jgi:hypothetical protein